MSHPAVQAIIRPGNFPDHPTPAQLDTYQKQLVQDLRATGLLHDVKVFADGRVVVYLRPCPTLERAAAMNKIVASLTRLRLHDPEAEITYTEPR